ncbi:pseudouridine synthase [Brevundimonas pishanensis]|uniref:pseudouridine synthase n=1 Tax=Brevundimonas pishanensis TaxID=2896315 RepID=UPI001FA792F0|nr:pseudouridine synthase [Brevundimonas pishanensis]
MDRHPRDNDKKPRARQDDASRGPRKFADKGPKFGSGDKKDRKFDDRGPRSRDDDRPRTEGRFENRGPKGSKPAAKPATPERTERIAKALARAGIASRREVERLIGLGKVAVNGRILDTPAVLVKRDDVITVDGKPVGAAEATRVWRYHKPAGLITSHNDPAGRPTVWDALPADLPRVISVGRLDLATEGLLLLTNDGELSRALELPDTALVRHYRARARGRITQDKLDTLKEGVVVDGVRYGPVDAKIDKAKEKEEDGQPSSANLWISVSITEGKNREVRKVLESLGLQVNRLIRLAYGPFNLGTLPVNTVEEVGPRVIREMLSEYIRPENLPTGNSVATPAPIPGRRPAGAIIKGRSGSAMSDPSRKPSRVRAANQAVEDGVPAKPARPVKKEGWAKAKPKFEHTKTFKPRARPEPREGDEGASSERPRKPFNRELRADQFIDDRRKPAGKSFGDKPTGRSYGDRPSGGERTFGGKPGGKPAGRSYGDRPTGERSFGDKPAGRTYGDRPTGERSGGDRPSGGKSFGGKPGGKPAGRSFGDRPSDGKPSGKPFGGGRGGPRGRS